MIDVNDLDGLLELANDYVNDGLHFLTEPVSYGDLMILAERLIAAEKDAARYRWLRDRAFKNDILSLLASHPSEWDEMVDEATQGEQRQ